MYYFAYGSNLSITQMKQRTGDADLVGTGVLKDFEIFVCFESDSWNGGVFSIRPKKGAQVNGAVYRIDEYATALLDRYEGFPRVYDRTLLPIELTDGKTQLAFVYISLRKEDNINVSKRYYKDYLKACKQMEIAPSFINS